MIVLKYYFYVPNFIRNLISVAFLFKDSHSVSLIDKVVIRKNKSYIYNGWMEHNLYLVKWKMYSLLKTEVNNNSKTLKNSLSNETCLWHLRLGYIALNMIQMLIKDGPIEVGPWPQDESCLEGKMNLV